jgi:hypothetical protein
LTPSATGRVARWSTRPAASSNLNAATSGPDISEEEHEVTFHEEIPAVEKRVVPRERVRLDTDTVTDQRQVAKEIRKEQVEVDEPGPAPPAGPALSRSRMGAGAAGPPAALSRQA